MPRIAAALPDLLGLSDELFVPFAVRRLAGAELAWLNERWFGSIGINCAHPPTRAALEQLLLTEYGVVVPEPELPGDLFTGPEVTFWAERYGATGGSTQGGGGRVGMKGAISVKGIGRTPLVSAVVDWQHSHGALWLEEAVREAVFAEIVAREFPHGAVPVLAVIATGIERPLEDGVETGERALVLRPNFLRIASLQRTIFFGTSGHRGADQYRDAVRTADLWERLWTPEHEEVRRQVACPTLEETFLHVGEQYGFGHCLRLWPGPIFSSNLSLDGRLLDFGSMRALPSWYRAQSKLASHSFGGERPRMAKLAQALSVAAGKYGVRLSPDRLVGAWDHGLSSGFQRALADHGIATGSHASAELRGLFLQQQQRRCTLWDDMSGAWPFPADHPHASLLSPRPSLFREEMQARFKAAVRRDPAAVEGRRRDVAGLIEHEIGLGLRTPMSQLRH